MNIYAVTVSLKGEIKTMFVKARDEVSASEKAQAEMLWGGRIHRINLVRSVG